MKVLSSPAMSLIDNNATAGVGILSRSYSTDAYPRGEEVEGWMHIARLAGFNVRAEIQKGERLRASGEVRALPGLTVARWSNNVVLQATCNRQEILSDSVMVFFSQGAGIAIKSRGRDEVIANNGEAIVMRPEDATAVVYFGGDAAKLRLPREALSALRDERLMTEKLQAGTALNLLKSYLGVLRNPSSIATVRHRELVVNHIRDLVTLAIGVNDDEKELAIARGGRAARLYSLKQDIDRFLFHHDLGAEFLARRNNITQRYVHMLFESEGMALWKYVLERRLLEAYRLLAEPTAGRVSDIAFSVGFNDLSYFNRTFAKRFFAKPRDVRAVFQTSHS
jgi:AraC-like DNA-binding protein